MAAGGLPGAGGSSGAGLGLPLVRLMVELHGGRIELDEVATGGLAVTLAFPPERTLATASRSSGSRLNAKAGRAA
jgi:signal transduction histidine kinase